MIPPFLAAYHKPPIRLYHLLQLSCIYSSRLSFVGRLYYASPVCFSVRCHYNVCVLCVSQRVRLGYSTNRIAVVPRPWSRYPAGYTSLSGSAAEHCGRVFAVGIVGAQVGCESIAIGSIHTSSLGGDNRARYCQMLDRLDEIVW